MISCDWECVYYEKDFEFYFGSRPHQKIRTGTVHELGVGWTGCRVSLPGRREMENWAGHVIGITDMNKKTPIH